MNVPIDPDASGHRPVFVVPWMSALLVRGNEPLFSSPLMLVQYTVKDNALFEPLVIIYFTEPYTVSTRAFWSSGSRPGARS